MEHNQLAPGRLEIIRTFLNTWEIPNDTREPIDQLKDEKYLTIFIKENFSSIDFNSANLDELFQFRNDIRKSIEHGELELLNVWLLKKPLHVVISNQNMLQYAPVKEHDIIYEMLQIIVESIGLNQWHRLKACPDCKWVFYDYSKNGSKRWCGMYAGNPKGRACGTIAKVKRYREKNKKTL
ncbi:CGNR zinc finger domain-containing protein [Bacillus sp. RG28]|uniref:CGNR zinc finger domain-containing protein n=1 Tax=Gottfriedia endophytica TaxID=2820819 RepID=A0A940SKI6_9BACI|nr:CGNR zinc finger domain-containing protein [Gottfriedia endophytica]MBP0725298.1 CGNR zinc finger domain-containing protein [Gottfriedia endophytica]